MMEFSLLTEEEEYSVVDTKTLEIRTQLMVQDGQLCNSVIPALSQVTALKLLTA